MSVEWDILAVPAFRNEEYYTSQAEQQEGLEDHEPNDDGSEYKVCTTNLDLRNMLVIPQNLS